MIEFFLGFFTDFFQDLLLGYQKWQAEKLLGVARSPLWEKTKREFAKIYPKKCAVCDTKKNVELHHVEPFHINKAKENDFTNLKWLCRQCHYRFGHRFKWLSWNTTIEEDIKIWREKIANRP